MGYLYIFLYEKSTPADFPGRGVTEPIHDISRVTCQRAAGLIEPVPVCSSLLLRDSAKPRPATSPQHCVQSIYRYKSTVRSLCGRVWRPGNVSIGIAAQSRDRR